jgi:hypothetical protein
VKFINRRVAPNAEETPDGVIDTDAELCVLVAPPAVTHEATEAADDANAGAARIVTGKVIEQSITVVPFVKPVNEPKTGSA